MNENDWISVDDSLPGINKEVVFKFIDDQTCIGKIKRGSVNIVNKLFACNSDDNLLALGNITHWRQIPEKLPDFSRLNNGDLIIIYCKNNADSKVGIIVQFEDGCLETTRYLDSRGQIINNAISEIKKITRINLEDKTFEEI
jgi:hypothetical protein